MAKLRRKQADRSGSKGSQAQDEMDCGEPLKALIQPPATFYHRMGEGIYFVGRFPGVSADAPTPG
jgi:hypothetical protein